MRRLPGLLVFVLCGLVLLGGCAFSPERALAAEVRVMEGQWQNMQMRPETAQIRQQQPWQEGLLYLLSFEAIRSNGQRSDCLYTLQIEQKGLGWRVTGSEGGCGPLGGDGKPMSVGWGQHSGLERASLSHLRGLVYDPAVVAVQVVWEDGQEQRVEVANGSYLALRAGRHELSQERGLDSQDEIVYAYENPLPAPGKAN